MMSEQIAQITQHLYLCGARAVKRRHLKDLGITLVINATKEEEVQNIAAPGVQTRRIPVSDRATEDIEDYFDEVADAIEFAIHSVDDTTKKKEDKVTKGRVLVHCVAGSSRSASLVIAYLMKYKQMSLLKAYKRVKAARPIIRPNYSFFQQLMNYEVKLFGKQTVKMLHTYHGPVPEVYVGY